MYGVINNLHITNIFWILSFSRSVSLDGLKVLRPNKVTNIINRFKHSLIFILQSTFSVADKGLTSVILLVLYHLLYKYIDIQA